MNTLFFAFANSTQPGYELPTLVEEEEAIKEVLRAGELAGEYNTDFLSFGSLPLIARRLQSLKDNLVWFHYSGHAEKSGLLLKDKEIRGEGMIHLLKQCPNLKGVVLNGCSTQWQAAQLLEVGIPVVIGTSSPVEDTKATQFSKGFYNLLSKKITVADAFEMAMGEVLAMDNVDYYRGGQPPGDEEEAPLWGLLTKNEEAIQLKLPFGGESIAELKQRLLFLSVTDLEGALNELLGLIKTTSRDYASLIGFLGQYSVAENQEQQRTVSQEYIDLSYRRIRASLTEFINDLEEEDLKR